MVTDIVSKQTKSIYLSVINVDSLIAHDSVRVKYYALDTNKVVFEYKPKDELPEYLEETYQIYYDLNRNPICIYVMPFSESGDWFLTNEYYFGKDGKTIFYRYCLNYFNSECTEIMREFKDYYFDSNFKMINNYQYYQDKNRKPIDFKDCYNPYSFEPIYQSFSNYESIVSKYKIVSK
ncbi:MAG: hypothetical protein NTX65_02155 [Ignavibacteriales bacterium]|nr:hypothetical protein [Ignavibacteriales bacterium]